VSDLAILDCGGLSFTTDGDTLLLFSLLSFSNILIDGCSRHESSSAFERLEKKHSVRELDGPGEVQIVIDEYSGAETVESNDEHYRIYT
jgi:FtsZ-interacting cell division protein ZipA